MDCNKSETYRYVAGEIERVTREFLETGVAMFDKDCTKRSLSIIQGPALQSYLRAVAKEFKRPYIHATAIKYHGWAGGKCNKAVVHEEMYLVVPKQKRIECLIAPLIFATAHHVVKRGYEMCKHVYAHGGVARYEDKTTWHFLFTQEGRSVFEHFLEHIRTDPVCRIALKL